MALDYSELYSDYVNTGQVSFSDPYSNTGYASHGTSGPIQYNLTDPSKMENKFLPLDYYEQTAPPVVTGMGASQIASLGLQGAQGVKALNLGKSKAWQKAKALGKKGYESVAYRQGATYPGYGTQPVIGAEGGTVAPIQYQTVVNPSTGQTMSMPVGETLPPGFEVGKGVTATGRYFQAMTGGAGPQAAVANALPTYLAGRLIRSAFDDADPTTFTAGEMAGAGVSGYAAGAGLAGLAAGAAGTAAASTAIMAAVPVIGIAGALISLFGGKKKRDKARELKRKQQDVLGKFKKERKKFYTEYRENQEREQKARTYGRMAGRFQNPYGLGAMAGPYGLYSNTGYQYQYKDGGKKKEPTVNNIATLDNIISFISEKRGYDSFAIKDMMNKIAFHESFDWRPDSLVGNAPRRFNPQATQYYIKEDKQGNPIKDKGGNVIYHTGTGKGLFQFEDSKGGGGNTAINRAAKVLKSINMEMPDDLKRAFIQSEKTKRVDASKLSSESQGILFLLDAYQSGDIRMGDYKGFGGKQDLTEWWFKNHKKKADDPKSVKNLFNESMMNYNSWDKELIYKHGGKKEYTAEFTGGESVVSAKDQKKIEKYIKGGDYSKAGKIVKKAPLTPGEASHKTNPLPVSKDGTVYDKYGNSTGINANSGAGIYDHGMKFNVDDETAGRLAAQDIEKWKKIGMYS